MAYREGRLQGARAKDKAELKDIQAPILPDDYAAIAAQVAARRMTLAGYRIADRLNEAFPKD